MGSGIECNPGVIEPKDANNTVSTSDSKITSLTDDDMEQWTPEKRAQEEKKLVRKLDMRFLPMMILVIIMNYIDRMAITAARLKGLERDLHLSDIQYDTLLAIFYVLYCPFQVPSNMILNKISRPSIYLGGCAALWGLISAMSGVTHNFTGIAICRVFLGLPEAAFYPGAVYLLSRWYTRKELAFRTALVYTGLLSSLAFGGLFSAGILKGMEGKRGIEAWRWLFYIEGAATVVVGFVAMWILPDFPGNTRWIQGTQRRLAQVRLAEDAAEADQDVAGESALAGLKMAVKDVKVWIFAIMDFTLAFGMSFASFFPTLTATLGYSTTISLLLTAPPWIITAIICLINSRHADKTGERFFHVAVWWWALMIGYIIALSTMNTAARYVSMCLMVSGNAGLLLIIVWVSNTFPRPPAKRAAAIAIVNGCMNLGSLPGSYVWKARWGPQYRQSMIIALSSLVICNCLGLAMRTILVRANREMDRQQLEIGNSGGESDAARVLEASKLEGIEIEEAIRRRKGFRYLY